jgi:putative SOS response-associated peptidase YedK
LTPADGFYKWRKTSRPKLSFAIAMKDGRRVTFAGLWENWKDPRIGGRRGVHHSAAASDLAAA